RPRKPGRRDSRRGPTRPFLAAPFSKREHAPIALRSPTALYSRSERCAGRLLYPRTKGVSTRSSANRATAFLRATRRDGPRSRIPARRESRRERHVGKKRNEREHVSAVIPRNGAR